jgi:hypothetical protein
MTVTAVDNAVLIRSRAFARAAAAYGSRTTSTQ